jgi:hypothetical protein
MDFTIKQYTQLLKALRSAGFFFQTFEEHLKAPKKKTIVLRHDVDLLPENSLRFANIQNEMGIKGSYYFRTVPESWDEKIIKEIAELGHEVGYHYETMDQVNEDSKDQHVDLAYVLFCKKLEQLRQIVHVSTICMHGSPRSKFDNKAIWEKYDYKKLGIIGEPYYDVDFDDVFYLTDTGRRWDGWKVSVRDKVPQQDKWVKQGLVFHSTQDIIKAVNENKLPDKIMMTFHPQRWHDSVFPWAKELIMQNAKNVIKKYFFVK